MRPLVVIDVDGPLNPWAARTKPAGYRPFDVKVGWWRRLHKRRHLTTALVHVDPATGLTARHLSDAREAFGRNP